MDYEGCLVIIGMFGALLGFFVFLIVLSLVV